jgi:uncharacterized protein YhaN
LVFGAKWRFNVNTIDGYVKKYVRLGLKDQILYDEIKPETEIEMDKIIEEATTKFSYLEIGEYIHRNFDIVIN